MERVINAGDKNILRELAKDVLEIASQDRMRLIKARWMDVNALRKPDRAPVWCKPVGCWNELLPEESLMCRDDYCRNFELSLRRIICKREIDDDTPVEGFIEIPAVFNVFPANIWGVDVKKDDSGREGGSWRYAPPLKSETDFFHLRVPRFEYDSAASALNLEMADDIFGQILPVKLVAEPALTATIGHIAADLRGLEQMMLDMAMSPELMHRLMSFIRDSVLLSIDMIEESGLLTKNDGPMNYSDPIGQISPSDKITCKNLWCMANSQEFDQVSPSMWEEFCLNYQRPIFERFGLVAYGCCENLTKKIDGVLSIPNLRIFVSSAWTDLQKVIEQAGNNYCIMWRQKASDIVFSRDTEGIKRHLFDGAEKLQGVCYQIVLRELQTLAGNPARLFDWVRIAKEAAEKYS